MFCKHCGKQIADDSVFCRYCGGKVENEKKAVSHPKVGNEDKVRNIVKTCLKELFILASFVGIAFLGKFLFHNLFIQYNQPPVVSEEKQQAFNNAIFKKRYPNGYEYPAVNDISFGIEASELGWGEYKYDNQMTDIYDLERITECRKALLNSHARKNAKVFFGVLLIGFPLLRYGILFAKWLLKSSS